MADAQGVTGLGLDKDAFFADMGYKPHPGQIPVHQSKARRRILACGVRFGKTLLAALEALAASMEPRERSVGWVVAPTYDLCDRVFREIVFLATEHLNHRIIKLQAHDRNLQLRNMAGGVSEIRGKSADNPVSLLGEGLDWLVVDEAARLKPGIWEGHLSQRLIDKDGWAILISTPKGKGWFYSLWRVGNSDDPDHESWNLPSWTNPLLSRERIERERERLPERVFRQEYQAEFIEGAGAVFRNVREAATGEWQEPDPSGTYYAGLDLAKVEDYTVLVIMNTDAEVVCVDRFHRLAWGSQVKRVKAAYDRYGEPSLLVDSTGVGDPICESLRDAGCWVTPYQFTQRSKAALIDSLSMMFDQGEVTIPRPKLWPVGVDELEAYEYSMSDAGNVKANAPPGLHDDCVIALALAAWELGPASRLGYTEEPL